MTQTSQLNLSFLGRTFSLLPQRPHARKIASMLLQHAWTSAVPVFALAASCMSAAGAPTRVEVKVHRQWQTPLHPPNVPRPSGFDLGSVNAYCATLGIFDTCNTHGWYDFGSLVDPLCDYSCFGQMQGSPNFELGNAGFCSKGESQTLTPIICTSGGEAAFERSGDSSVRVQQCDPVCADMKTPTVPASTTTRTTKTRKPPTVTTSSHPGIPDTPHTTSSRTRIALCILSAGATLLCVVVGVGAKRSASRSGQATKRRCKTQAFDLALMPHRPAPTYGHIIGLGDDANDVKLPHLSAELVLGVISSSESDHFNSSPSLSPSSHGGSDGSDIHSKEQMRFPSDIPSDNPSPSSSFGSGTCKTRCALA